MVAAYQDRMRIRGITRTFGVCYQTVMIWLGKKAAALPAFEDTLLPSQSGDVLELDELWSYRLNTTKPQWYYRLPDQSQPVKWPGVCPAGRVPTQKHGARVRQRTG